MPFTPLAAYPNYGTTVAVPPTAFPTVVADGATWNSDLIASSFGGLIFGATSDHAATLNVQRYADLAGLVPVGAVLTQALTANVAGSVGVADGLPYLSFNAQIVNSAGAAANVTNAIILRGPSL